MRGIKIAWQMNFDKEPHLDSLIGVFIVEEGRASVSSRSACVLGHSSLPLLSLTRHESTDSVRISPGLSLKKKELKL